jgi:hypothetical protein
MPPLPPPMFGAAAAADMFCVDAACGAPPQSGECRRTCPQEAPRPASLRETLFLPVSCDTAASALRTMSHAMPPMRRAAQKIAAMPASHARHDFTRHFFATLSR